MNTAYPSDWLAEHEYHGISRHNHNRKWTATLSVSRKQRSLGFFDSAADAARAYDAALFLLRPVAPLFARPNDPAFYATLTDDAAATLCPTAARIAESLGQAFLVSRQTMRASVDNLDRQARNAAASHNRLFNVLDSLAKESVKSRLRLLQFDAHRVFGSQSQASFNLINDLDALLTKTRDVAEELARTIKQLHTGS